MIIERTSTPWTASAVLFRQSLTVAPFMVVNIQVDRKNNGDFGLILLDYANEKLTDSRRYSISRFCSWMQAVKILFKSLYCLDVDFDGYEFFLSNDVDD